MKNFLKQVGASLVALFIFSLLIIGIVSNNLISNFRKNILTPTTHQTLKSNSILHIGLQGQVTEHKTTLFSSGLSLSELSYALKNAAKDKYIKAVYIEVGLDFNPKGYAHLEAMLHELKEFKKSGKPVVVYSPSYTLPLLSALSYADTLVVNPVGQVSLQGPATPLFNYKGLLNRLGINPIVYQSGKNKNAGEPYTELVPRPDTKNHIYRLLASFYKHSLQNLSKNRGIQLQHIEKLNQKHAFLTPYQAKLLRIIDKIAHQDEAREELAWLVEKRENKVSDLVHHPADHKNLRPATKTNYIDLLAYNEACRTKDTKLRKKHDQIIIIPLEGSIVEGKSPADKIGSEDTADLLEQYTNDESCKAVVLIIDSPGGSVTASEKIRHAVATMAKRKPVVALIRNVGASGGYYIIMNAHWVMSQELSIIGSIGVISMNVDLSRLLQALGIHVETIKTSPYADINDMYHNPNEKERAIMQNYIGYINNFFRSQLIAYRNLDPEKLADFADGRVFLAEKAKEHGLIDQIGHLPEAIEKAATLANLEPGEYTVTYHQEPLAIKDFLLYLTRQAQSNTQQALIRDYLSKLGLKYTLLFNPLNKHHR